MNSYLDRLLIWFLVLLFLVELLDPERGNSPLARRLANLGKDTQRFIASTAETGAIIALANLLLLSLLGVDFALIWCLLYFFLHFIPSIGFMIALVPPTLLALLMLGWKKGLLVLVGLFLTEMLGENVLKPALLKKGLDVGLIEVTLSLVGWGFLLGPAGAVLSVPLTLGLRRFHRHGQNKPNYPGLVRRAYRFRNLLGGATFTKGALNKRGGTFSRTKNFRGNSPCAIVHVNSLLHLPLCCFGQEKPKPEASEGHPVQTSHASAKSHPKIGVSTGRWRSTR